MMPDGAPPLTDPGNPHITPGPATLSTGTDGTTGVITIRDHNTTLTVLLAKHDVHIWAGLLAQLDESLSASGLIVAASPGMLARP